MKKKITSLLLCALFLGILAACGQKAAPAAPSTSAAEETTAGSTQAAEDEPSPADPAKEAGAVTIRVGVPTAPPALPVLHMIEENLLGSDVNISLDVWNTPEQLIAMVQGGEHDMFAFPLTVVAKLHNTGVPVTLMNVNTWGVTYFMTSDPDFKSWEDLKGKTVYVPLQSSPPDALTQFFMHEAGLTPGEDVEIIYASTAEVGAMLASGEAAYATLIEPQVTATMVKNDKVLRALSFESEWQRVTGTDTMIPNAGFGVTNAFLEDHAGLTADFQKAYEESVKWVNENPEAAGALAEKYLEMKAPVVTKAIPSMGLHFKNAEDAKEELTMFYQLLNNFDAKMIGGKLPDDSMFYHAD
ncbi:MAG: ABC transporter substrate-binding protein [Clostridium sp.]|nr:ABC transporter substrate-binding protein [Clostridium sp.]